MKKLRLSTQLIVLMFAIVLIVPILLSALVLPSYKMPLADKIYEGLQTQLSGSDSQIKSTLVYADGGGALLSKVLAAEDDISDEMIQTVIGKIVEEDKFTGTGVLSDKVFFTQALFYAYEKTTTGEYRIVMSTDYIGGNILTDSETMTFGLRVMLFFLVPLCLVILWYAYVGESIRSIEGMIKNNEKEPVIASAELQSLADSIDVYKRKIEEDTNQKQSLFQNISHELKTPITTIKMYAEGIEDGIYLNGDMESSLQVIKKEADILLGRVNKIMEMNKLYNLNTQLVSPCKSSVNLSEVVFETLDLYQKRAPDVKFEPKLDKVSFRGDKEIWNTILQNILDNNIKHGAKNISVSVSTAQLQIINDGDKIDEKLLPRIFEPFVKGEKGNFGLGLNIIKRSLDMLGYDITISNVENGVRYLVIDRMDCEKKRFTAE